MFRFDGLFSSLEGGEKKLLYIFDIDFRMAQCMYGGSVFRKFEDAQLLNRKGSQ